MLGKTITNRYKITEEVNQDSLTVLYKAQDLTANKPVFIRFLKEKTKERPLETLLRFKREIEQLSKFSHPNLLKIYSYGDFEGQDYVVYEYFDSKPLLTYLGQPLPTDTAVEIILQISSALGLAHQNGILHQALQPQNILITQDLKTVKLANFGYNLLIDISRISETQEIIATFGYLSPESSGILRKPLDGRSDIYSLGILFYQLVTGRLPYAASDISTLIHQHIAQKPASLVTINNKIPPAIENIVLRLIAKEPQERYQSLSGLIIDLKEYQKQRKEGKEFIDFEIARGDRLAQLSFSTRLIGRDKELNQLKTYLEQAKDSKGAFCTVFGEPGIGKSRLVDELRGHIHSLNGIFCGGKCYQYEFRTPYTVFSEAIDAYIEKIKRLSREEQEVHVNRIKNVLGELGGEVVKITPAIIDLIGQPPKLVELDPEKQKVRFLITIVNFLASLSTSQTPMLMFLDDLQWVDDGSLEILERLAEKIQNIPVVLIVSYRDTEVSPSHPLSQLIKKLKEQKTTLSEIPVKPFAIPEISQMISQIIMEKEEDVLLLARELDGRAKGNPFFTLELLHSLVDSKIIFLKENHYNYDLEQLKSANLPATIVEAVLKRMKDLSEEHIQILSYASVMGKEIDFKLLAGLARRPNEQVLNSIEDGIENQLLYRELTGQENVFFAHDRVREAFYQKVPQEERVPLHRHIAEALEEQNKDNIDPVLYDLAHHFSEGGLEDKALQYSIPAAHKAKASYANALAGDLYDAARKILEKQDKKRSREYIEVLESSGEVYRLAGKFDESLGALKACESLIPSQDLIHKIEVLSKVADTLWEKGELDNSTQVLEQALKILGVRIPHNPASVGLGIMKQFTIQMIHTKFPDVFISKKYEASPRDLIIVSLLNRLATIYYFSDLNKTFYGWLMALNRAEKFGPCSVLAYDYVSGGPVWVTFPWFSRSFRDLKNGLKMSQELGDKITEGIAYAYLGLASYAANMIPESIGYAQKSMDILQKIGEYFGLGTAYSFMAGSYALSGQLKKGFELCEEFIDTMKRVRSLQLLGFAYIWKTSISCSMGNVNEETINEIKEAHELTKKINDKTNIAFTAGLLGLAYSRMGNYPQAIEEVEKAAKLFPTHYNGGTWSLDQIPIGAEVYLDAIVNIPDLPAEKSKEYLKRAGWFAGQSLSWGNKYRSILGWAYQVNGTYLWLTGEKKKAVKAWEMGIKFLREKTADKYRLGRILLEEATYLLQDNPKDKKALSYLLESRELFIESGCQVEA